MPSIQEYRWQKNQDYFKFVSGHNFSNVQTADTVAKYFCDNFESMDFSNPNVTYANLVGWSPASKEADTLNNVTTLVQKVLEANNSSVKYVVSEREHFVDISAPENAKDSIYSECKLWLNVKHQLYPIFVQAIMNYLAQNSEDKSTSFKICTDADRNDCVSIYTDYANAGPLIDAIKQLKETSPTLFEPDAKDNPLIAQVDDVVSYADVGWDVSYPQTLALLLSRMNLCKDEISKTRPELRQLKAKKVLLETMVADARELQTSYDHKKTYLLCPENLSSVRSSGGIPYKDLTYWEIDKEIDHINDCIHQVNVQARKVMDKLVFFG